MNQQDTDRSTPNLILSAKGQRWLSLHPCWGLGLVLLGAFVLASSWLAFPYLVMSKNLLFNIGSEIEEVQNARAIGFWRFLSRDAYLGSTEVSVVYATPEYFAATSDASLAGKYRPDRYLVFMVEEATHIMGLPTNPPQASLIVDGTKYVAADVDGAIMGSDDPGHHRGSTIRFPRTDTAGEPILKESTARIELHLSNRWDPFSDDWQEGVMVWELPISYSPELLSPNVWSPMMVMNLSTGLLMSILTPCLIPLMIMFLATVTGSGVEQIRHTGAALATASRALSIAVAFIVATTLFYTAVGALIGWLGNVGQSFPPEWNRTIRIVSSILVILLGLWNGIKANAPLVREIPVPNVLKHLDESGIFGAALLAVGFSLGCMTSFSGVIIATLFIYVGSLDSAGIGALALFILSTGIAAPFLLAALFMSRMLPLIGNLSTYTPRLAFASMGVVVALGVVLIGDNFSTLSDLSNLWLGLD